MAVFLSCVPADNTVKYLVALIGIVVPVLFFIFSKSNFEKSELNFLKQEQFETSFSWLWIVLGLFLIGLRFWKLTTLFQWPAGDEAEIGMVALGLMRHWNWKFCSGFGQTPFLIQWVFCFFYEMTHSSKLALWFFPAFVSTALIPFTYLGAKQFWGNSFSVLLTILMAVGIWPMYLGRVFCPISVFLWEVVALYLLLVFLKQSEKKSGVSQAIWLGLITGLGSLTLICWVPAGFVIVLIMTWISIRRHKSRALMFFFLFMIIALLPFLIAIWNGEYGSHARAMGFWNGSIDIPALFTHFLDYWMILWGTVNRPEYYCFSWGGILNPVLASLFFLGLIEIGIRFSKCYFFLFLLILTACLSSGFLSLSIETYRILAVIPFIYFAAALGLHGLLSSFSPMKAGLIAFLVILSSFVLDFYRLTDVYFHVDEQPARFETTGRSYEKYRAGKILENMYFRYGPGLIYADLIPSADDETLSLVTYSYNCAWNPALSQASPRWAALFTNSHYQAFLSKKFPQAQWISIPAADPKNYGLHVLGLIPMTSKNESIFRSWQQTYVFCMNANLRILDYSNLSSIQSNLKDFINFYPRVPNDAFLQSFYLGKLVYEYSKEKGIHGDNLQINYDSYAAVLDLALKKACPDTLVDTYIGRLLIEEKQFVKAKDVLKQAIRLDPQNEAAIQLSKIALARY
jgi:hypothetical protein